MTGVCMPCGPYSAIHRLTLRKRREKPMEAERVVPARGVGCALTGGPVAGGKKTDSYQDKTGMRSRKERPPTHCEADLPDPVDSVARHIRTM
jgi:hypothetical protein